MSLTTYAQMNSGAAATASYLSLAKKFCLVKGWLKNGDIILWWARRE